MRQHSMLGQEIKLLEIILVFEVICEFPKAKEIHLFLPVYFVIFLFLISQRLLITLKNLFQNFYSIFLFSLYVIKNDDDS